MTLDTVIDAYLAFKRALGMRLESGERVLRAFARRVGEIDIARVSPEAVLAFLAGRGPVTRTWQRRASVLRSFYRYAVARGFVRRAPLPAATPKFPPPRRPYLYSTDDLQRLLAATEMLESPRAPLRALGYRTLLLLLYGAGLRLDEALSLTLKDVDLANRLLTVRNTKFFKTRLVPIGPQLTRALAHYAQQRSQRLPTPAGSDSAFLATTRSGTRWHCLVTEELFRRLRQHAGIGREGNARNQPCLHDLRHTAAQHRLLAWYRAGRDVQPLLLHLATYLGHVDLSSTQYYLAITPELLHEANQRFARYAHAGARHA